MVANSMAVANSYLFIDQNPSDKVIPCLIVKIVSEELSNLKKKEGKPLSLQPDDFTASFCFCWTLTCGEQILIWQSRRSCLISNSSLPLWKIFCEKTWASVINQSKYGSGVTEDSELSPLGTGASSALVSSGSVKSAGSCCPWQQWHHLPHSGTCDLATIP